MAERSAGESSPETDIDFDPSAEMLIEAIDDERTMEEEEAMEDAEVIKDEVNVLQREGDMPLEELLAMYGYGSTMPAPLTNSFTEGDESSSSEEILSNQDLTLDKEEISRDLLTNEEPEMEEKMEEGSRGEGPNEAVEEEKEVKMDSPGKVGRSPRTSVSSPGTSSQSRLLRSAVSHHQSDFESESEDDDYIPDEDEEWKKVSVIQVGSDYQAQIPEGLCQYDDAPAYENDDKLLWDPSKLTDAEVEEYLRRVQQALTTAQTVLQIASGAHTRDDEQALYVLLQCGGNIEEAIRRTQLNPNQATESMSLWSEDECRSFENGLRTYGKDFHLIQQNKVRTRSVGELVQFYYFWKKTERHDIFANKARLEKKKYTLHPGNTDFMDRFLDEQDNSSHSSHRSSGGSDRPGSPGVHSLLYGDPKRQRNDPSHTTAATESTGTTSDTLNTDTKINGSAVTALDGLVSNYLPNGITSILPTNGSDEPKLGAEDELARNISAALDTDTLESLARFAQEAVSMSDYFPTAINGLHSESGILELNSLSLAPSMIQDSGMVTNSLSAQ